MKKTATRVVTLVALILTAAVSLTGCSANPDKTLQDAVDLLNKSTPMTVDSDTRLDSAEVQENRTLCYNYTLVNYAKADISDEMATQIKDSMVPMITAQIKSNADLEELRKLDVSFKYVYKSSDDQELFNILVTPQDYA